MKGKNRRQFLKHTLAAGLVAGTVPHPGYSQDELSDGRPGTGDGLKADVVIIGGGLGGVASALALTDRGYSVILVEEYSWLGGQLTSQGVPPDENQWIETFGGTRRYQELRNRIRDRVRSMPELIAAKRAVRNLNPGNGSVSRLCIEPRIAAAVIHQWLLAQPGLRVFLNYQAVHAETRNRSVTSVTIRNVAQSDHSGADIQLSAPWFIDATELGDLLPLTGTDWTTGNEGKAVTGELHAPEKTDPENQQAFTLCFALQHDPNQKEIGPAPEDYAKWREYIPELRPPWPGRLFDLTYTHPRSLEPRLLGFNPENPSEFTGVINLWTYRRIAEFRAFNPSPYPGDVSLINWPQNDYLKANLIGASPGNFRNILEDARQMNLCLMHWLRTEVPRPDGGHGFPGLQLCPGAMGTPDGMAMAPYIRESRRIKALYTITEADCGVEQRSLMGTDRRSEQYEDSVGIGHYPIDLHPTTAGDNYIDFPTYPFQIPLRALIPRETRNLIAANKNIGTTHLTNGCYRLHPVEWNIGEAAGNLIAYCLKNKTSPHQITSQKDHITKLQSQITGDGIRIAWPDEVFG